MVLLDNLGIHTPKGKLLLRQLLDELRGQLILVYTPAYDPDANRIEWLWRALRGAVTHTHTRETLAPLLEDADAWAHTISPTEVLLQIGSPFADTPTPSTDKKLTHAACERSSSSIGCDLCSKQGVLLKRLAHERGVPLRTAQRWLQRYRVSGLAGLSHQTRADRGRRRRLATDLLEGDRRPGAAEAGAFGRLGYRRVCNVAEAHEWPRPSDATVYSVIRALGHGLVTLAHEGPKRYAEQFEILYRREASRPNEMWQADHTPLDMRVYDERGRPARPWLTIILDDYSRVVAGYPLSLHAPSSIQAALALRQAIWRKGDPHWSVCGIPETFYNDHGSDFTSKHLEQRGSAT
jgi:transposase InsO family protein